MYIFILPISVVEKNLVDSGIETKLRIAPTYVAVEYPNIFLRKVFDEIIST